MSSSSAVAHRPSVQPRVRRAPRASRSDADDACFLSSSYGLTPDDWQEDVLIDWLGRRSNGRWAAATCGLAVSRQNGKNGVIEMRELYGMVHLGEKFLHTAHEVKTARKAFLRIASFFENVQRYPELNALVKEIRKTNGQEAIVLTNGGSVEFIARSKGSGRGFTVDVLVCDEAQDLTDEELAALLPTISSAPLGNPQFILAGTPPDPLKIGGEPFARTRDDGENNRDPRLAWTDFGVADGPLPDVWDDDLAWSTNPALGSRLQFDEVERERRVMTPAQYAAERLGWWGDPGEDEVEEVDDGLLGDAWVAQATHDRPSKLECIGLAVSVNRAFASIGGVGTIGTKRVLSPVMRRRGTRWVVAEVVRLVTEHACTIVVDSKGPAKDLIDDVDTALREANLSVEVTVTTTDDYLDAWADLVDGVGEGDVWHVVDEDLDDAVGSAALRYVNDRALPGRRKSAADIDMLEAETLASWGILNAATDYDVAQSFY